MNQLLKKSTHTPTVKICYSSSRIIFENTMYFASFLSVKIFSESSDQLKKFTFIPNIVYKIVNEQESHVSDEACIE